MRSLHKLKLDVQKILEKNDSSHDFGHIMRVYKNAKIIAQKENVNLKLVLAAVLLHDIVSFPKSERRTKTSSKMSSVVAQKILQKHGFTKNEIKTISDAICDHSFSRGVIPHTVEGKVLQDADRLDAIGAIGIARAFAVSGAEKRPFYNKRDPFCKTRRPDDKSWTLDHFYKKLLLLEKRMNTKSAKLEARNRMKIMKKFLQELKREI